jgi:hypothetical protein
MHQHRGLRDPFANVGVALCVVALLIQGTLLPLAHAWHEAGRRGDHAAVGRARTASVAVGVGLRAIRTTPCPHDATACPLCAVFAHGRTGVIAVAIRAAAPQAAIAAPSRTAAPRIAVPSPTGLGPRAPPSLTA